MLSANPGLTVDQVKEILRTTSRPWGPSSQNVDYGWGRIDAWAAVKAAGSFPGGSAPAVPGHLHFAGSIPASGGRAEHTFTVNDPSYPLAVTLIMPNWTGSSSPDFDLYVYNPDGSELARSTGTGRQEQIGKAVTQTGTYKATVRSYAGAGAYFLDISGGFSGSAPPPDAAPTVAIDAPASDGESVSGTFTVKVRAADDQGVSKVELAVDGGAYTDITASFDSTHYRYDWNTGALPNGEHTLTARATDTAGQTSQATRRVQVNNQAPPPPPPGDAEHEVIRTGTVTGQQKEADVQVTVGAVGYIDLALSWPTSADLDFYVYGPDGSYIGRAYTLNNPERLRIDTVRYGTGTYTIRASLYRGPDTPFTLSVKGYKRVEHTGTVTPARRDSTHAQRINFTGRGLAVLNWPGGSDLDFFVYDPTGRERARGYTLRKPEQADVPVEMIGDWSVRVNLYSGGTQNYTLHLYIPEAILT